MNKKVTFVISFEMCNSEKEILPSLSAAFEATLERFLLPRTYHFERRPQNKKSGSLHLVYTIPVEIQHPAALYYLGKMLEGEAGILQLFDEAVKSFSMTVEE